MFNFFFILPAVFIISKKFYIFYIIYLVVLEIMILLYIIIRTSKEALKYRYDGYKLKIILGITSKTINIICDKVVFVHVENDTSQGKNDFKIILIASSKFRSDRMLAINRKFLKNHAYLAQQYYKIKTQFPENSYYYTIIKRGGLKKYPLLDLIYRSCVYATFSEESIDTIKYYRDNSQSRN